MDRHPTDETMVNGHFEDHAPCTAKRLPNSTRRQVRKLQPRGGRLQNCHLGTCPGPSNALKSDGLNATHPNAAEPHINVS